MQSLKQIEIIYLGEYEEDEVVGEEEEEDEDEEEDEYAQFIRAIIFTHFLGRSLKAISIRSCS